MKSDTTAADRHTAAATTVLLIRHAHTDAIGAWLTGRADVHLSAVGIAQAERLGRSLSRSCAIAAIYTSPLARARSTAAAVGRHQSLGVRICDDLSDIDFGEWSGRSFAELERDPAWRRFNTSRATAHVPGGEQPGDVQHRIVGAIARLTAAHQNETIAIVSHADVIRFALLHYEGRSLDLYHSFEVEPASVSAVSPSAAGTRVLYINDVSLSASF
jgi:probable phosphoglycerate mutase